MCMQKQRALRLQNFFMALSEESSVPAWKLGLIRSKNVGSWNVDEVTDGIKCSGMPLQLGLELENLDQAFPMLLQLDGNSDRRQDLALNTVDSRRLIGESRNQIPNN